MVQLLNPGAEPINGIGQRIGQSAPPMQLMLGRTCHTAATPPGARLLRLIAVIIGDFKVRRQSVTICPIIRHVVAPA